MPWPTNLKASTCVRLGLSVYLDGILVAGLPVQAAVESNGGVGPILSDKFFACHGPDAANRKTKIAVAVTSPMRRFFRAQPWGRSRALSAFRARFSLG